ADRMEEYRDLGIEEFILSGYPHLEEAYAAGEGLLPELRRRGLLAAGDVGGDHDDGAVFSFRWPPSDCSCATTSTRTWSRRSATTPTCSRRRSRRPVS